MVTAAGVTPQEAGLIQMMACTFDGVKLSETDPGQLNMMGNLYKNLYKKGFENYGSSVAHVSATPLDPQSCTLTGIQV